MLSWRSSIRDSNREHIRPAFPGNKGGVEWTRKRGDILILDSSRPSSRGIVGVMLLFKLQERTQLRGLTGNKVKSSELEGNLIYPTLSPQGANRTP